MSFGGDSASFEILVDTAQLAQAGNEIGSSIAKGVGTAKREVAGLDQAVNKASRAISVSAQNMGKAIGANLAKGIKSNSASVQAALIQAATQGVRGSQQAASAAARSTLAAQNATARQQLAQTQNLGKQQAIIAQSVGQQAVIAARTSGAQRVAITRAFLDTIGRLEKGLGRVIEGTAKTIVGATQRIFAGTVGSIQRSFAQRHSVITRNLNIENGLFASSAAIQQRTQRGVLGFGVGAAGLIGGGALAAGAIRQIFTLGSDFTRGLNVLQAQLQLTEFQMLGVDKLALQLGNDIKLPGVSALDAAQAIGLLAKQFASVGGFAIAFAEDAAKGTLQLARATGATAEEAAQAVGAAVNVFKADAKNAVQIADQLAAGLSQAAGTSFSDFNLAFTQGAAVVSNFLVPAEGATNAITEFTAAIAILARGGVIGSDAGTSLKQFFLQANRGTDDANTALAEISKRAGVTGTAFFTQEGKARSLFETIAILRKGLEGLTDQQKQATIQTLFGADAARSASILIGQGEAEFLKTAAAVQRQGAAAELAAAQNKGLAGALDAIKSQFETFAIQIFQKVNKPLGNAGLAVANFVDRLANAGGIFAAVRAGLKGIGIALGSLLAIKGLVEVAGFLKTIVGALGPLGIAAIVLGGALGFLLKRFGSFRGILEAVGRLVDRVAPAVARLREVVFGFLSGLAQRATFLGRFRGFLSQIFDLLGQGKAVEAFDRLKTAAAALLQNLKPIGDAVRLLIIPFRNLLAGNFVEAFKGFQHVAQEIASTVNDQLQKAFSALNPFAQIGLDFVKKFKAQFIGGGIGAVAGGIIGGPFGVVLGAALGVAATNAILKLKGIIGRVDVAALFGNFLDGVEAVGRKIGEILSDKRVLLGVAGIAAAAAAIAGTFIKGFVSGIVSNLGDIRAAGAQIVEAIFSGPSIVKSVAAFVLLIRGALTGQFRSAGIGKALGSVLGKDISDSVTKTINEQTLGTKLKGAFSAVGKGIGQALTIGISAALSGSALGNASSSLEKGLGIAGIAGSAAAAFTAGGGLTPTGIGAAAATVGVGLLTAALTANAKKSAEAKAAMLDYRNALDDASNSGKSLAEVIDGIFSQKSKAATDDQLKAIKALGVNLKDFQDALAAGKGTEFLAPFEDRLRTLQKGLQSGVFPNGVSGPDAQREIVTLNEGLGFLRTQVVALNSASQSKALHDSLFESGTAADRFEQRVTGVSGSADRLTVNMKEAAAQAHALFKEQRAQALETVLSNLAANAKAIGDRADESKRKLAALLHPELAPTPQAATDQQVTQIPTFGADLQAAIEKGLSTAVGSAEFRTGLQTFSNAVGDAFQTAVTSANPGQALSESLFNQTIAINQLDVSPEAKQALLDSLNAQFATAQAAIPLGVEARQADAAKAGIEAQAAAEKAAAEAGLVPIRSGADLVQAQQEGAKVARTAGVAADKIPAVVRAQANTASATTAGSTIHSTAQKNADKQITVGNKVTATPGAGEAAGRSIATNVGTGFKNGLSGLFTSIQKTVTTIVNGAVINTATATLQISSPSKVFMGIGEDTMKGLEQGIRDGGSAVQSAVESVAQAMIDSFRNPNNSIPSALKTLFDSTFEGLARGGGSGTSKAVESLTTALRSVISQVSSNAETLFSAASKPAGERTLAERLLLGESFTSLRAGDEFGVANRGAIAGAVDAIKAIGQALLEQGFTAQQAADQLLNYRSQLLLTAVQAGLSASEVDGLINSLGLSVTGLQQFVNQADKLNQIVAEGQRRAAVPNTPPPLTTGPNPTTQFITNNLYLPTGDPEANALAVVNRQALAVR